MSIPTLLTTTERKFLIRALNRVLMTKTLAVFEVKEILNDKNLTLEDIIVGKQETEIETETKAETAFVGFNFDPENLTKPFTHEESEIELEAKIEKPHIRPIPTDKIINDLAYASDHIHLLTPRQQEFIEEKFTSRNHNWISDGKDFTQKQKDYLGVILIRINSKILRP